MPQTHEAQAILTWPFDMRCNNWVTTTASYGSQSSLKPTGKIFSICQGGGEDKTSRLDSQHDIDAHVRVLTLQPVNHAAQTPLVFQERCYVIKEDPRLGEVRDFTDELFEMIQKAWSLRAKGTQLLHGSFLLFNPTHLGHARSLVQKGRQLTQLIGSTSSVDLDPAVVFIADPAPYPDQARVLLDEITKPDALDPPGDKPSARLDCPRFQLAGSWRPAGSESLMIASIAERKFLTVKGFEMRRNPLSTT